MFIVDDIARGVLGLASDVVEAVTGGAVDPSDMIQSIVESPMVDIVFLGVSCALGNPLGFTPLAEELSEILQK